MKTILSKLEEIKNLIPKDANDITKFMAVYKWIGIHATYASEGTKSDGITKGYFHQEERNNIFRITRSLLGVLIEGEAVCEGFSWALVTCLNYIGVSSRVVTGSVQGVPHGWIHIKIDGIWYNACLTGDYMNIRFQKPLNFCLRSDTYFKENGFQFDGYEIDLDEIDVEEPLEKCMNDYPRNGEGNLLNDNSSFIDEYYKGILNFYQLLLKENQKKEDFKIDLNAVHVIEEENKKRGKR